MVKLPFLGGKGQLKDTIPKLDLRTSERCGQQGVRQKWVETMDEPKTSVNLTTGDVYITRKKKGKKVY